MDIEKFRVADLKAQLAAGDDVQELLAAMKEDSRVSVRKLAAAICARKSGKKLSGNGSSICMPRKRPIITKACTTWPVSTKLAAARQPDRSWWPPSSCRHIGNVPASMTVKKVPPAKRDLLYDKIMAEAVAVSCVAKSEKEIDELDIYHATMQGMYDAVNGLAVPAEAVLVDAMPLRELTVPHKSLVHGDALSASIAAASIIAKVTRDRLMVEYDKNIPVRLCRPQGIFDENAYGSVAGIRTVSDSPPLF